MVFTKNKIEVIPFREFMSPPAETIPKVKPHTPILYSLVPGMTVERFFDMSPQVATAYALVLGVGGIAILSHLIETSIAKSGLEHVSYIIEKITSLALPIGTYAFMFWVLYKIV